MNDTYIYLLIALVIAMLLVVALFAAFYQRSAKDRAYVRTGFGGEHIMINNGGFVFPILHDIVPVNMQTLRVEISRDNKLALITKDPLRVDVVAEFFMRVAPDRESISTAARTLGNDTLRPEAVKDIVEAQCVAALRSVASTMTLDELHVKRTDFELHVEETLNKEFEKNGLELVSVSLMRLDQTQREYFDETNAFDAQGLIKLDQITEESKKRRNDIEQENKIKIQERNKESEQKRLMIQQQEVQAQKEQEKYIAELNAVTAKEIEEIQVTQDREIEEIRISKETAIEMARRDMEVSRAEFEKGVSEAWMLTDKIKAEAARLTEEISTARETAEAEREKMLEVIGAQKEAQRQTIIAEANAEVERLAAKAAEIRYQVEAVGKSAMNRAANLLSNEQISMQVKMEIVRQMPQIIRESVKPLENIDGIKITHLDGLNAASGGGNSARVNGGGGGNNNGGLADQVVDSALRYRAQVPLIDSLLQEVGLQGDSSDGLTKYLRDQVSSGQKETPPPASAQSEQERPAPPVPPRGRDYVQDRAYGFVETDQDEDDYEDDAAEAAYSPIQQEESAADALIPESDAPAQEHPVDSEAEASGNDNADIDDADKDKF